MKLKNFSLLMVAVAALVALNTLAVHAESDEHAHGSRFGGELRGKTSLPSQTNHLWQQECGSCHLAFPPGLLPADSWRKLMGSLGKHFGGDASLPAAQSAEITTFLTQNASNRWSAKTAPLRITESGWFKAKHNEGEIDLKVWSRKSVKGPWNCEACHAGAAKGEFDEHSVRIPA